ncbi:hypothetical protein THAOC_29715, partial [Thalassiosira oceanica]
MTYDRGYVTCDGSLDQQFKVPSNWLPDISVNAVHTIELSNNGLCFDTDPPFSDCNNPPCLSIMGCRDVARQQFVFDASTRQIKQGSYCLDATEDTAFMNADCQQNLVSQHKHSRSCLDESKWAELLHGCIGSCQLKLYNYAMDCVHARIYNSTSRLVMNGQYCLDATVQTSNGTVFNNTVYMNTCDSTSPSQQCLHGLKDGRNETLTYRHNGGNQTYNGEPCRWCCGNECDKNNNKCEPEGWLLNGYPDSDDSDYYDSPQPGYESNGGVSMNGIGDGYCPDDSQAETNYLSNCLAYNSVSDALEMQPCQADNDDQQFLVPLT